MRRLLEYQKYKQAGADSPSAASLGATCSCAAADEEAVQTGLAPLAQVPLFSLVEAFQSVLSKSKVKLSHDIVHERITLTDRINELVDMLRVRRRLAFEELFAESHDAVRPRHHVPRPARDDEAPNDTPLPNRADRANLRRVRGAGRDRAERRRDQSAAGRAARETRRGAAAGRRELGDHSLPAACGGHGEDAK